MKISKNNLEALRKAKDLTQKEVGKRLDLTHNSISGYETGKTPLTPGMVERFAKALEISVAEIKVSEESPTAATGEIYLDSFSDSVLEAMKKDLLAKAATSREPDTTKIMHLVVAISREQERRPSSDQPRQDIRDIAGPGAEDELALARKKLKASATIGHKVSPALSGRQRKGEGLASEEEDHPKKSHAT